MVANSIDGEEELVDVTMKDSNSTSALPENNANTTTVRSSPFRKQRPKFIDPTSQLDPSFQNIFELGYFSGAKEMIPTGWSSVDDDKVYPSLSSRAPQTPEPLDEDPSNPFENDNGRSDSESSDEGFRDNDFAKPPNTRMTEESSDEDEDPISVPVSRVSAHFL